MNPETKNGFRKLLSRLIPDSPKIRYLAYLPRLETWRKSHPEPYPVFEHRYELYRHLSSAFLSAGPIVYLEFGVFEGATIAYWSMLHLHPESRFWGFDTFSGLPEAWDSFTRKVTKGGFDTQGQAPDIQDTRVAFVKGLFQETLPAFLREQKLTAPLVIHNDSDLYPSTLYVLSRCNDLIRPGTIIIFDEFSSVLHELRALEDYCSAYMRDYTVIGATKSPADYYAQVAIRMR